MLSVIALVSSVDVDNGCHACTVCHSILHLQIAKRDSKADAATAASTSGPLCTPLLERMIEALERLNFTAAQVTAV
jgi:hypothetical protein